MTPQMAYQALAQKLGDEDRQLLDAVFRAVPTIPLAETRLVDLVARLRGEGGGPPKVVDLAQRSRDANEAAEVITRLHKAVRDGQRGFGAIYSNLIRGDMEGALRDAGIAEVDCYQALPAPVPAATEAGEAA